MTNSKFLTRINKLTNLYAPLVVTKELESAFLLLELMVSDLSDGLVEQFILEQVNNPPKILGEVVEGKLQSMDCIMTS
jgi:hypothetical protein